MGHTLMARYNRQYFANRFVAQEAKRSDMRSGDHEYARGQGRARFQAASETINTDQPPAAPTDSLGARAVSPSLAAAQAGSLYPVVNLCRAMRLPEPVPEHPVCDYRRWRFDFAWPMHWLALEVEGGIWTQGRHTRGTGALADLEKYSEAAILGWRVLYCTPTDLLTLGMDRVRRALSVRA